MKSLQRYKANKAFSKCSLRLFFFFTNFMEKIFQKKFLVKYKKYFQLRAFEFLVKSFLISC